VPTAREKLAWTSGHRADLLERKLSLRASVSGSRGDPARTVPSQGRGSSWCVSNADETFAEVKRVGWCASIHLPIMRDEDGLLAQALGVRSTPTVVLLDERGRARFVGWFDNERTPGEPDREPWLELALQGVLENRSDFATRSPVYGCTIAPTSAFRRDTGPFLFGPQ